MDQTIKQTMNRDSKQEVNRLDSLVMLTLLNRWILLFNLRAEISRSCTEIARKAEGCHNKKDLSNSWYDKDEVTI